MMRKTTFYTKNFSIKQFAASISGTLVACCFFSYLNAQESGWIYEGHEEPVYGVAVGSDGYIYTASHDNEVHKIDAQGNVEWVYTEHNGEVNAVTVDDSGYVYTAAQFEGHKIDPSGNQVWVFDDFLAEAFDVAVDDQGRVYFGAVDMGAGMQGLYKVDEHGNEIWSYDEHGDDINGIALDDTGNVFTASGDGEVHKVDSNGNNVWKHYSTVGNDFFDVTVDPDGYVYAGGQDSEIHKLNNSDGDWIVTYDAGGFIYNIEADNNGNVYVATLNNKVIKVDTAFNEFTWAYLGHSRDVLGIAVADNGDVYSASFDEEVHQLLYNESLEPEIPELTSPGSGEISLTPTMIWEEAQNADVYHLEIDDTFYFTNPEIDVDTITQTEYTVQDTLEPDEGYYWRVRAINEYNFASDWPYRFTFDTQEGDAEEDPNSIEERSAENFNITNYPNPFVNQTEFLIDLNQTGEVSLEVFDASGQLIETPIAGRRQAGTHRVVFNGADYPAGVYFYRFNCGNKNQTGKMILQK